jgi:hypothetical protein
MRWARGARPITIRAMRLRLIAAAAALVALAAVAPPARATGVLVLGAHGARWHDDRYLPATELPPPPPGSRAVTSARARRRPRKPKKPPTLTALAALVTRGAIGAPEYYADVGVYKRAVAADARLRGTRRAELAAVIANADRMAAAGAFTVDRLGPVFMTLDRNTQWWTTAPIPAPSDRVGFSGSELVWEYYPGQGIELQALGSFGKANGLWQAHRDTRLRALVNELVPLAVSRGGASAWEYYFDFDGGTPPWTSAISQGTAVQALAHASQRLGDPSYAALGQRALPLFETPPPLGVRVDQPAGPFYIIYSFDPNGLVINAFLQAVIGLHDFAQITGDPTASALFQSGDAEARAVVPNYDTGAWSLYAPGQEDTLDYHDLVTGFLKRLCKYTGAPAYCVTESHFTTYLHTPPTVTPVTTRIRAGRSAALAFTLDKISHVEVEVLKGARVVFSSSGQFEHGTRRVEWSRPVSGTYTLRLVSTDLAGNRGEADGQLTVLPKRKRRKSRH